MTINLGERSINPMKKILGNLRKTKPPMFNGEVEKCEEDEAWLLEMNKYL